MLTERHLSREREEKNNTKKLTSVFSVVQVEIRDVHVVMWTTDCCHSV